MHIHTIKIFFISFFHIITLIMTLIIVRAFIWVQVEVDTQNINKVNETVIINPKISLVFMLLTDLDQISNVTVPTSQLTPLTLKASKMHL